MLNLRYPTPVPWCSYMQTEPTYLPVVYANKLAARALAVKREKRRNVRTHPIAALRRKGCGCRRTDSCACRSCHVVASAWHVSFHPLNKSGGFPGWVCCINRSFKHVFPSAG